MQNFRARLQTRVPLEEQYQVLSSLIQISQKQSSTPNAANPTKRSKSIKYFLVDQKPENQVYLSMFLNTFSISHKKVKVICNKKVYCAGMIIGDQRGKHEQQRKLSKEVLDCIKKHIESFPAYRSQYSRKDSDKKYLCPSLCLSEMYRLYVIECSKNNLQSQKKHMYRKVFNEQYNFSFHPPSKDTCEKCDIFKAAIISAEEEEKSQLKQRKNSTYRRLNWLTIKKAKTKLMLQPQMIVLLQALTCRRYCHVLT